MCVIIIIIIIETWAMKKENLCSLERTEWMMVSWMWGVSLKDRKHRVDLYSLLGVQSEKTVQDVVRHGRLRWFEHLEHKSLDDWVLYITAYKSNYLGQNIIS